MASAQAGVCVGGWEGSCTKDAAQCQHLTFDVDTMGRQCFAVMYEVMMLKRGD